jgi:hypothetical protein
MSFDLGVWKSRTALSRADADDIFGRLCESDLSAVEPTPAVQQFYTMLTTRYPELDDVPDGDVDRSPWSARLDVSDRHVAMSIVWSRAEEVAAFVRELAAECDLVCYNPQVPVVHYPASVSEQPRLRLYSENGTDMDAPAAAAIAQLIQTLTPDGNYFAILERTDTCYMQAALSDNGVFAIEYRDGGPEWHYRCAPVTRELVVAAFQSYASQDDRWRDMFAWQRLEF